MRGYSMSREDYLRRLRRIEGQVRGLQRMVEQDDPCTEILTQIASVTKALQSVGLGLLDEHLRHCVLEAARAEATVGTTADVAVGTTDGTDPSVAAARLDEAMEAVERLLRT